MTMNANTKQQRRAALRARLEAAQRDIYANARTPWADDVPGFTSFYEWLGDYAQREAGYMTDERFGMTEKETAAPSWRPASERLAAVRRRIGEKRYPSQHRDAARNNHGFPCGSFETERAVLIRDGIGKCYSYGRNAKTFYPTDYAHENGTGFHLHDVADELNAEALTRAVQWLEQFNAHVRSIAADAPAVYRDEAREHLAESAAMDRDAIAANRAAFATLADELRTLRGINAPAACEVLRGRLSRLSENVRDRAQALRETVETLRTLDGVA
jgi:hypothetical protein